MKNNIGINRVKSEIKKAREANKLKQKSLLKNKLVGQAGESAVFAELVRKGFIPEYAAENHPFYDIRVHCAERPDKSVLLQVKTRGIKNKSGWRIGSVHKVVELKNSKIDLIFVIVDMTENGYGFYVFIKHELVGHIIDFAEQYMSKNKRDGSPRKMTGAWTFEGQRQQYKEVMIQAKDNWGIIDEYLTD